MALAESIFAKLSHVSSATGALVGTGSDCRVHAGIAPTSPVVPYVVQTELPSAPDATLGEAAGSSRRTVQLSCVAATYRAARAIAAAIIADLDNATLAAGEVCLGCSDYDGFSEATDQHLCHVDADFFAPTSA